MMCLLFIVQSIRHISLRRSWDGINMLQFTDIIKRQCLLQKIYNITMQLQTHLIVSYFLQGSDQERYNGKSQENQMVGLVAHVPYAVIAPFVGIVFMVVYKVHRAKNDMVMDVSFVNVRREYILMLPLCYRVGKLLSDFMGFLIIDFPRLKGLYQMKG